MMTIPLLAMTLTKQEFSGNLMLEENNLTFESETLPEVANYSGFIVYEADGTLLDWEVFVDNPSLDISAEVVDSNTDFSPTPAEPNVEFELVSPTD